MFAKYEGHMTKKWNSIEREATVGKNFRKYCMCKHNELHNDFSYTDYEF